METAPFRKIWVTRGYRQSHSNVKHYRPKKIIHARSTSAGIAALLRFPRSWIWDCRSLQADQRRALSNKQQITASFLLLRFSEYLLAKQAKKIIVITEAVIPVLISRYKISRDKIFCIPTCVDVERFAEKPLPITSEIRILLAGTFSPAYDLELTNKIINELKRLRPVTVTIAASAGSTDLWKSIPSDQIISAKHHEMPKIIQNHHIGMSIWKNNLGVCLTSVASTKTAEFLACGRPIFVNSLQGDFAKIVNQELVGVVTDNSSVESVTRYASQMLSLLTDLSLSKRCHRVSEEKFNLHYGVHILQEIYSELEI